MTAEEMAPEERALAAILEAFDEATGVPSIDPDDAYYHDAAAAVYAVARWNYLEPCRECRFDVKVLRRGEDCDGCAGVGLVDHVY